MKALVYILSLTSLIFIGCSKNKGSNRTTTTTPYYGYSGNTYNRNYIPNNYNGTIPNYNTNNGCNGTAVNYNQQFIPVYVNGSYQCWSSQYIYSWNSYYQNQYGYRILPYRNSSGHTYYRVGYGDECSSRDYVHSAVSGGLWGTMAALILDESPGKGFAWGAGLSAGSKALYCYLDGKRNDDGDSHSETNDVAKSKDPDEW